MLKVLKSLKFIKISWNILARHERQNRSKCYLIFKLKYLKKKKFNKIKLSSYSKQDSLK